MDSICRISLWNSCLRIHRSVLHSLEVQIFHVSESHIVHTRLRCRPRDHAMASLCRVFLYITYINVWGVPPSSAQTGSEFKLPTVKMSTSKLPTSKCRLLNCRPSKCRLPNYLPSKCWLPNCRHQNVNFSIAHIKKQTSKLPTVKMLTSKLSTSECRHHARRPPQGFSAHLRC
jgi:hypothetical protein